MTFRYRLAYYMVGFIIGMFFVALVWSGKDARCNYFPNARVLNDLRTKPFHYSEKASAILAESWIDTVDIKNTLEYGDVDFDKSNTTFEKGKLYTVEGKTLKQQPIVLELVNYSDRVVLHNIEKK
jgi:hypothetical protein